MKQRNYCKVDATTGGKFSYIAIPWHGRVQDALMYMGPDFSNMVLLKGKKEIQLSQIQQQDSCGKLRQELLNNVVFSLSEYDNQDIWKVPKRSFQDMFIRYFWLQKENGKVRALSVNNDMCKCLQLHENELFSAAAKNTAEIFPPLLFRLTDITSKRKENLLYGAKAAVSPSELLVLTNEANFLGSSNILYKNVLERIGKLLDSSFFVIPNSQNEVVIASAKGKFTEEELYYFFDDNSLSENLYYYDRDLEYLHMIS